MSEFRDCVGDRWTLNERQWETHKPYLFLARGGYGMMLNATLAWELAAELSAWAEDQDEGGEEESDETG